MDEQTAPQPEPARMPESTHLDTVAANILKDAMGLATAYLGEKAKRQNILNYAGANLAYIHAKNTARKVNMTESESNGLTPYPGSKTTNVSIEESAVSQEPPTTTVPPAPPATAKPWKRWLFNAGLLALGFAVPWAPTAIKIGMSILNPTAVVVPEPPPPNTSNPGVGLTVE